VFGLRMLAVKKSMNLSAARSPAAATIAGTSIVFAAGSRIATAVGQGWVDHSGKSIRLRNNLTGGKGRYH